MRSGRNRNRQQRVRGARVLVFACAASAGAHAGLVPAHLDGEPRLGFAFLLAVVLLLICAAAVAIRPSDRRTTSVAGLVLGGLIAAYLLSRTTGIPGLDPEQEALDAVGAVTNIVEAIGVVVALWLIPSVDRPRSVASTTGGVS